MGWPTKTGLPHMCLQFIKDGVANGAASDSATSYFRSVALSRYGGARSIACDVRHAKKGYQRWLDSPVQMQASTNEVKHHLLLLLQHHMPLCTEPDMLSLLTLDPCALDLAAHTKPLRSEKEGKLSIGCLALEDPDFSIPQRCESKNLPPLQTT